MQSIIDQPAVSCCFCKCPFETPVPGRQAIARFERLTKVQCEGVPCAECLNAIFGREFREQNSMREPLIKMRTDAEEAIRHDDYCSFSKAEGVVTATLEILDGKIRDALDRVEKLAALRTHALQVRQQVANALGRSPSASYFIRRKSADAHISKPDIRFGIFKRDGFACRRCKSPRQLTIDHVLSVRGGGTDDGDNLQTLCRKCNCRKGAR